MSETPISPFGCEYINDLSAIAEDKSDVVDFLLHRVERGQIYTWVGPLLLAVNPEIPILQDLFSESKKNEYLKEIDQVLRNAAPHIYAVATRARYHLIQGLGKISQVIVISGESGTGKTFSCQKIIDFLAGIDKNRIKLKFPDGSDDIASEIGQICPLIAAFSTAETERNPGSSRHGQLIQLQYTGGVIKGARVHSFLLERTRVTMEAKNFNIFYQLINGISEETLNSLCLSPLLRYTILGENSYSQVSKHKTDFRETLRAMNTLGFSERCQNEIFQVLALLLLMGNIKFKEKASETFTLDTEDEESRRAIENACKLSVIREHELNELLTSTLICPTSRRRRHTLYRRGLRTQEACRHRLFSVIRWIYDRLFHWLVDRINETLSNEGHDCDCLGILDIFGFESFATNGIEQLCINYSTERLQLYFMENYLENTQKELEYEGLSIIPPPPTISIYRNRLTIIEQTVFSTMNDAAQSPIPPNLSTISQQLYTRHADALEFLKPRANGFVIDHYSCPVEYNIYDILEKNEDKVPLELSTTFYETGNSLLKVLANVPKEVINDNGKIGVKKCTTLSKLKSSMDSLMQKLNECDVHYVRCVKPRRLDDSWQRDEFREQLVSSGIFDALPLAKCKFPIRLTYEEFSKRYYSFAPVISDFKLQCRMAVEKMSDSETLASLIHLGHRRIFITEELFFEFECLRKELRTECAHKIASFWLKHKSRKSSSIKNSMKVKKSQETLSKPAIIVTRPSLISIGDDDVFVESQIMKTPVKLSADDLQNNNTEELKSIPAIALNGTLIDSWSPMKVIKPAENSTTEIQPEENPTTLIQPPESPEINEVDLNLQQERITADSQKNQPVNVHSNDAGWRAKDLYVAEWLDNISLPSDIVSEDVDASIVSKYSGGSQREKNNHVIPKKYGKFSKFIFNEVKPAFDDLKEIKWSSDRESCVIHLSQCERLFYRSRVLSKRRISECMLLRMLEKDYEDLEDSDRTIFQIFIFENLIVEFFQSLRMQIEKMVRSESSKFCPQ